MTGESFLLVLVSACLSGLLGTYMSNKHQREQQEKQLKLNLASDIFGYRYQLLEGIKIKSDFTCALNKVPIVFSNNNSIVKAYEEFLNSVLEKKPMKDRDEKLFALMKSICEDIDINHLNWDENLIKNPFHMNQ
ncbi:hypothetical protein LNN31_16800 [Acetobacterium wieringae]|uniref:DUF6680 domain-containing protein n=1 Tax=Acetobacterium wieringae TaxID=52694 RepID=A0ABY6HEW5_9FIRM|nr:DUF6680 family protein [Acetobacterium wieringae]MEA4805744.1 DUF6680 family protein [Acetobacterium wieringae]UYO62424.1 hypothetical protein LNN31_16800 [Acetobacterium wieringae]VUZ25324.1 Uncharacterised protein [Acetobacterium wieringae]